MMERLQQAFHEEARELLSELETALLELDQRRDDAEIVARVFRALHTIKGSGAMFGFEIIAAFAHHLEAVFDRLRKGQLEVTSELINLSLESRDLLKSMFEQAGDPANANSTVDDRRRAGIVAALEKLASPASGAPELAGIAANEKTPANSPPVETLAVDWRIHFRPGPDVVLNGTNLLLLLRELRQLGPLEVNLDPAGIPPLDQMDPERCYVSWEMLLTTAAPYETIRDVFIFIESECELKIEAVPGGSPRNAPPPSAAPHREKAAAESARMPAATSSIRVSADKLDELVNLVGELVTVQARLSELAARRDDPDVLSISEEIDRLTTELRENSMSIRMLPLRNTFERFRRLVHDLGHDLGKEVDLVIEGAETELDKTVIDQLHDPLVHLVRNCMDHGIEPAGERRAAGKPVPATIRLSAVHSGAQVLIHVSDDGRGLDGQRVRKHAIEQGLVDASAQLSESELLSLILSPGFSTAKEVTDLSGRGVGMDVVRRSVEALRGSVEINSKPGCGLTVTLRLPLTLAIIDGLLVRVAHAHFILPLANSLECVELTRRDVHEAHGNHLAMVRGESIPYIRLSEHFEMHAERPDVEQVMIVETEDGRYGLVVDEVLGNHQTVIKNLGKLYRDVQFVSGATILGNGAVALIIDPQRLVQEAVRKSARGVSDRRQRSIVCPANGEDRQPAVQVQ